MKVLNQEKRRVADYVAFSGSTSLDRKRVIFQINKTTTRPVAFRSSHRLPYSDFGLPDSNFGNPVTSQEKEFLAKQVACNGSPNLNLRSKVFSNDKEPTEQVAFRGLPNTKNVSKDKKFDEPLSDLSDLVDNGSTNIGKSSIVVHSSQTHRSITWIKLLSKSKWLSTYSNSFKYTACSNSFECP